MTHVWWFLRIKLCWPSQIYFAKDTEKHEPISIPFPSPIYCYMPERYRVRHLCKPLWFSIDRAAEILNAENDPWDIAYWLLTVHDDQRKQAYILVHLMWAMRMNKTLFHHVWMFRSILSSMIRDRKARIETDGCPVVTPSEHQRAENILLHELSEFTDTWPAHNHFGVMIQFVRTFRPVREWKHNQT